MPPFVQVQHRSVLSRKADSPVFSATFKTLLMVISLFPHNHPLAGHPKDIHSLLDGAQSTKQYKKLCKRIIYQTRA